MTRQATIYLGALNDTKERPTLEDVANVTSEQFQGATIAETFGLWEGAIEPSYTITLIDTDDTSLTFVRSVGRLARRLKARYSQDAVLVTLSEVEVHFV